MTTTTDPFFSIITVTRNNADGLRRTAASLAAQDMDDYEWIVIDGASTDDTAAVMAGRAAQFLSEPDSGIYDAMNKGLSRARGHYILFMNAGDTFAAGNTLSRIKKEAGNADFIYGDALEQGVDGTLHYKVARPPAAGRDGMITHHQSMLYRRALIGDLRFDTRFTIAADFGFTGDFMAKSHIMARLTFPICVFEPGGISQRESFRGRREQFVLRAQDGMAPLRNIAIFAAQSALWALRRHLPALYWRMKARR